MAVNWVVPGDHPLHDPQQVLFRLATVYDNRFPVPHGRDQLVEEDLSLPGLVRVSVSGCAVIQTHLPPCNNTGEMVKTLQDLSLDPEAVFSSEVGVTPKGTPKPRVTLEDSPSAAEIGGAAPVRNPTDKVRWEWERVRFRQVRQRPGLTAAEVTPLHQFR